MDRLAAIRTLLRVIETGSFSVPARELGVGQPAVSKAIARLENELGARLVGRTTRRVTATPAGRRFAEEAGPLVRALDERFAQVARSERLLTGTVRIAVAPGFGRACVLPVVRELRDEHPGLSVEIAASDRHVDLVAENIDLAIRGGVLASSNDVALRVAQTPLLTVASTDYLARHGEPQTPAELDAHDCVVFFTQSSRRAWRFGRPKATLHRPERAVFLSSNADDIRAAVLAGVGFAQVPGWLMAHDLADGRVRPVLRAHEPARVPLFFVRPPRRRAPDRVRAIERLLLRAFEREPHVQFGPMLVRPHA